MNLISEPQKPSNPLGHHWPLEVIFKPTPPQKQAGYSSPTNVKVLEGIHIINVMGFSGFKHNANMLSQRKRIEHCNLCQILTTLLASLMSSSLSL